MQYFFSVDNDGCAAKIISIDLSHLNSFSVKDTNNMFKGCSSLEAINFNNFDTSKVTDMNCMFSECSSLKSLDLSNLDTSKVTNMTNMFSKCTSLEYLDISNCNTLQVTDCEGMFLNANALKYINLYNAQISQIKDKFKEIMKDSTIICQKDGFKIDEDITYIKACCKYNDSVLGCFPENYITIQYNKNIIYENGFQINKDNFPECRKDPFQRTYQDD